jgi:hypothetical protein
MARPGNYPTTYDQRKSISITDLRKWKYLQPGCWKSGTLSWSRNGTPTGTINIRVDMISAVPYIELIYTCNEQSRDYKVSLVQLSSNLGVGYVWYFLCPFTHKQCKKLYLISSYFQHREAIQGYYEKQIESKKMRYLDKAYGPMFKRDKLYDELYSRHFRKFYNGKPTKRYAKILSQLKAAERVDKRDFVNAMVK